MQHLHKASSAEICCPASACPGMHHESCVFWLIFVVAHEFSQQLSSSLEQGCQTHCHRGATSAHVGVVTIIQS